MNIAELFVVIAKTHHWAEEILFDLGADAQKLENVAQWIHFNQFFLENGRGRAGAIDAKTKTLDESRNDGSTNGSFGQHESGFNACGSRRIALPYDQSRERNGGDDADFGKANRECVDCGGCGCWKNADGTRLAYRMAMEDVPEGLKDRRLVSLDIGALVAGADAPGALEKRMMGVIEEGFRRGKCRAFY